MNRFKRTMVSTLLIASMVTPLVTFAAPNGNAWGFWARFFGNGQTVAQLKAVSTTTKKANTQPVISSIKSPTTLPALEEGTWVVNAFDPQNEALTYTVDWGDSESPMAKTLTADEIFTQTSTFTHTYATPGTYKVKFTVSNDSGKKTSSTVTVRITQAKIKKPVISNLFATSTKKHAGTVTWTTDQNSDTAIWISTTSPVNTDRSPDYGKDEWVKNHKINANGLMPNTLYYVVAGSENDAGISTSTETSFRTLPEKNKKNPVINSITGSTTVVAGTETEITVEASDPNNSPLTYSVDWGDTMIMARMALFAVPEEIFTQTSTFTHIYENPGTYTATFTVKNEEGKETSSSIVITVLENETPDNTAPVITGIPSDYILMATSTGPLTVFYTKPTATDNIDGTVTVNCTPPTPSQFALGTTTVNCTAADVAGNTATSSFKVIVTPKLDSGAPVITGTPADFNLMATSTGPLTVFYTSPTASDAIDGSVTVNCSPLSGTQFAIGTTTVSCTAADTSGNTATSSFKVIVAPRTVPPVITNIFRTTGSSTTTVTWTTDEPANSRIYYGTTTPLNLNSSSTPFVSSSGFVTSHSLNLLGLATSTVHYFVIQSVDPNNNTATSSQMTFTTESGL